MGKWAKVRQRLLGGQSDQNIAFDDLTGYLRHLGFVERVKGSHHIFTREAIEEIINLQTLPGGLAKPYQVKQVRALVVRYQLGDDDD